MEKLENYLYRKADGVFGQSEEILNHVAVKSEKGHVKSDKLLDPDSEAVLGSDVWKEDKRLFLYRNLQTYNVGEHKAKNETLRMVFSGMLGVAQDVAGIVKNIPWKEMGVEFHIFGGGKQLEEIHAWIAANPECGVVAHGFVPKEEIAGQLREMDASIVPLATRIRGAFPSKVFDILPQGLPILFCGGGEGAKFVASRNVGFTSEPGDYEALRANIERLRDMSAENFQAMSGRCIEVSRNELDFDKMMKEAYKWLEDNSQ